MPAQKRASDEADSPCASPSVKPEGDDEPQADAAAEEKQADGEKEDQQAEEKEEQHGDSGGSPSSSGGEMDEFVLLKLSDIRKEVQCPICLGIIRKTRTVMECLHRFCRECIDKSMRLGNNECPACRTHCASRRSLRDDPNYDALIAAIYPDIDKYEEEELAFHEEEKCRNEQIQASIAQTLRRQTEALVKKRNTAKATAAAFARKAHGNYRSGQGQKNYFRGKGRSSRDAGNAVASEDDGDDDYEGNGNEGFRYSSSADDRSPDFKQKTFKRFRASPVTANDASGDENDDREVSRESTGASPGLGGNPEVLVWGGGGIRSHTRYGSMSGSSGKFSRCSRISKLIDYLLSRISEDNDDEFDIHFVLLSWDEECLPNLQEPYLCCQPSLSMKHLCEVHVEAEELEIMIDKSGSKNFTQLKRWLDSLASNEHSSKLKCEVLAHTMEALESRETLSGICANYSYSHSDLVLVYRRKPSSS